MNPRFEYRNDISYPKIESRTDSNGSRVYFTPSGNAPSVTTILASLPHPGLDEWRERVGEEEAERISKEARDIGTAMHNMLEAYARNIPYQETGIPEESIAKKMFAAVRMMGLRDLQEIWGIEVAVHYDNLYAGRTDLVGIYGKKLSVIDYKTAKYFKKDEWVEDYRIQVAAYAMAHQHMFPEYEIAQAVLLIGTRPNPGFRVPPKCQRIILGASELEEYKDRWLEVLEGYYGG